MSSWFLMPQPRPAARLKLFCVPHAGRGASLYMPWRTLLPDWIEMSAVQLPGREGRLAEPPMRRVLAIADALAREIEPRLDRPYALFGHSMGALVCYETARVLRRRGARAPVALLLSGRRAPTGADRDLPTHDLSDAELVSVLSARYNGIPQIILDQPDMMRMLLPIMRADLEAIETYAHQAGAALEIPFFLYGGRDDEQVSTENIAGWRSLTTSPCEHRFFSGGHFYLQDERKPLIDALVADLAALDLGSAAPGANQRARSNGSTDADHDGALGCNR